MTKTCKKILSTVFLALCFVLCIGAFAACDEVNDEAVKYTVTVQTDATTPVKGVKVQIGKGNAKFPTKKTTDENGKVEFDLVPDEYTVSLSSLPDRYEVPASASLTLTKDERDLTVTLEKISGYTVKLVNPDGTPYYAEGVTIGICTLEGNCLTPVALGTDGVAIIVQEAGDYHVKIYHLPDNVKIDCDADGYYSGENFTPTKKEMTITVTPVTSVDLTANPMNSAEKTEFGKKCSAYDSTAQEYNAYKTAKTIDAGKTEAFSFTAPANGKYYIFTDKTVKYATDEFANGILPQSVILKAGKTFLFTATNTGNASATAEFVITAPFSTYLERKDVDTLDLTIGREYTNAIVVFTPASGGLYSATVQGGALAVVSAKKSEQDEIIKKENRPADGDYKTGASASLAVPLNSDSPIYFAVTVKASQYPVNVQLKIEKKADSTYTYKEVEEELKDAEKPAGKLIGIPMDGTSTDKLNKGNDGYYHFGKETDSPIVYVKITKPLEQSRFESQGSIAYFEMIDRRLAKYAFNEAGANGAINTVDYTVFLRGFKSDEYEEIPSATPGGFTLKIPTNITTERYYAKFVNEDGAYPLTEELKVFLEKFYAANLTVFEYNIPQAENNPDAWLFPCYYYGEATADDPIVGEYELSSITEKVGANNTSTTFNLGDTYTGSVLANSIDQSSQKLTAESAVLRLTNDGGVSIVLYSINDQEYPTTDSYSSGTWSKTDETYSFSLNQGTLKYASDTFTYANDNTTIIFKNPTAQE